MPQLDKVSFFYSIFYVYVGFFIFNILVSEFFVRAVVVNFWASKVVEFLQIWRIFFFVKAV